MALLLDCKLHQHVLVQNGCILHWKGDIAFMVKVGQHKKGRRKESKELL